MIEQNTNPLYTNYQYLRPGELKNVSVKSLKVKSGQNRGKNKIVLMGVDIWERGEHEARNLSSDSQHS